MGCRGVRFMWQGTPHAVKQPYSACSPAGVKSERFGQCLGQSYFLDITLFRKGININIANATSVGTMAYDRYHADCRPTLAYSLSTSLSLNPTKGTLVLNTKLEQITLKELNAMAKLAHTGPSLGCPLTG